MTDKRQILVTTNRWLDPAEFPPPRSSKVLLLTVYGVAILGPWGAGCVAWAPLPQIDAATHGRLQKS